MSDILDLVATARHHAKLLNNVAKLALLIAKGEVPGLRCQHDGEGFNVATDALTGAVQIDNVKFYKANGDRVPHHMTHSTEDYPLELTVEGEPYYAFYDDGRLMPSLSIFATEGAPRV